MIKRVSKNLQWLKYNIGLRTGAELKGGHSDVIQHFWKPEMANILPRSAKKWSKFLNTWSNRTDGSREDDDQPTAVSNEILDTEMECVSQKNIISEVERNDGSMLNSEEEGAYRLPGMDVGLSPSVNDDALLDDVSSTGASPWTSSASEHLEDTLFEMDVSLLPNAYDGNVEETGAFHDASPRNSVHHAETYILLGMTV